MPITSLILECSPQKTAGVDAAVGMLPGAEVAESRDNFLVVVTDTTSRKADKDLVNSLADISGVICTTTVYTNREDVAEADFHPFSPSSFEAMEV